MSGMRAALTSGRRRDISGGERRRILRMREKKDARELYLTGGAFLGGEAGGEEIAQRRFEYFVCDVFFFAASDCIHVKLSYSSIARFSGWLDGSLVVHFCGLVKGWL